MSERYFLSHFDGDDVDDTFIWCSSCLSTFFQLSSYFFEGF